MIRALIVQCVVISVSLKLRNNMKSCLSIQYFLSFEVFRFVA